MAKIAEEPLADPVASVTGCSNCARKRSSPKRSLAAFMASIIPSVNSVSDSPVQFDRKLVVRCIAVDAQGEAVARVADFLDLARRAAR